MDTSNFVRNPIQVEAIQVTSTNITEVAAWCDGKLHNVHTGSRKDERGRAYIKVDVQRPQTPRQTKAFVGDWVLKAPNGFKVFTNTAFKKNFAPVEYNVFDHAAPTQATLFAEVAEHDAISGKR